MTTANGQTPAPFMQDAPAVISTLGTDAHQGLTSEQAAHNLNQYGPNAFTKPKPESMLSRIVKTAADPMLIMLMIAAAITLGVNLNVVRNLLIVITALLTASSVAVSGCIGFVGLVIPHMVRILFGTDHKKLIPISALLGAIFLLWSDVLCRVVLPGKEIPIGVLTALVGAPVFIYLMARKKYGFGGGD